MRRDTGLVGLTEALDDLVRENLLAEVATWSDAERIARLELENERRRTEISGLVDVVEALDERISALEAIERGGGA